MERISALMRARRVPPAACAEPDAVSAGTRLDKTRQNAALRLARFNTMLEVADKRFFQGLPSPSAAALVAGFVWIMDDNAVDPEGMRWWAWAVTVFAGLTMVSNFKYYSFKTINLRRSVPFVVVFLIALFFVAVSVQPAKVLFAGFVAYALSGYVWSAWLALKRRRAA